MGVGFGLAVGYRELSNSPAGATAPPWPGAINHSFGGNMPIKKTTDPTLHGTQAQKNVQARVRQQFESFMRDRNQRRRLTGFLTGLETLTAEEAPVLRELISELDREGLHFPLEWPAFINRWGELDGPAATAYALKCSSDSWVENGMKDILDGWASKDAKAAAAWLNSNSESPYFEAALKGIVSGLAGKDPAAATRAALASLPAGNSQLASGLMEQIAEAVVRSGKNPALLAWYDTLPAHGAAESIKRSAFPHVWFRLQHADLGQAANWLAAEADKPWRDDLQYSQTTTALAKNDPAAALNWAGTLPPSPTDGRWPGVNSSLRLWLEQDPAAATAYVNQQPDTPFGKYVRESWSRTTAPQ
jgi:hypothetical protein